MHFPLLLAMAAAPSAADWLTAWGSVATGTGAVIAVGVTVWLARRDRQHSDRERADDRKRYEAQLAEEREGAKQDRQDAERRLREERAHAELLRRRDRQQASAGGLLAAIAGLMPFIDVAPNLYGDPEWKPASGPRRRPGRDGWSATRRCEPFAPPPTCSWQGWPTRGPRSSTGCWCI